MTVFVNFNLVTKLQVDEGKKREKKEEILKQFASHRGRFCGKERRRGREERKGGEEGREERKRLTDWRKEKRGLGDRKLC